MKSKYNSIIYQDKIDHYIHGFMPEEEKKAFDEEISNSPELAKEIQKHQLGLEAENILVQENLIARLEELDRAEAQSTQEVGNVVEKPRVIPKPDFLTVVSRNIAAITRQLNPRITYAITAAASIAILVISINYFSYHPLKEQPPQANLAKLDGTNLQEAAAEKHYNSRAYGEAIPLFEELLTNAPDNHLYQYYLAISLRKEKQLKASNEILIELYEDREDNGIGDKVRYQLAMTLVADSKKGEAVKYLKEIIEGKRDKALSDKAAKFLEWLQD